MKHDSRFENPSLHFRPFFEALSSEQIGKLHSYADMLRAYNQRINLISRADSHYIWEHHILPSLTAQLTVKFPENGSIVDVGSGGGLPGIPIKILLPQNPVVLIDSIRKKTLFLKKVVENLALENITVINERLERGIQTHSLAQQFSVVTIRAVGSIMKLYPLLKPLLHESGFLLFWKGETDIPDLKASAERYHFKYEIIEASPSLKAISAKVDNLLLFMIVPL